MEQQLLDGRYQIIEELGRGGMGTVFKAWDTKLDRLVAIKQLPEAMVNDAHKRARFEREARTLTKLAHRNIVTLHDFGGLKESEAHLPPFLVMQWMQGGSLSKWMAGRKVCTPEETLPLIKRVSAALDYIHNHDVIHRDLKPANILLDKEGAAFLADFGIAKLQNDTQNLLTKADQFMGTLAYMSPEQIANPKDVDGRSDIYSLGIILFELLSGSRPFQSDSMAGLIKAHREDPVPDISQFNKWLPYNFNAVLKRALAKKPEDRFGTAQALVEHLEEVTTQKNVHIPRPSHSTANTDSIDMPRPQPSPPVEKGEPNAPDEEVEGQGGSVKPFWLNWRYGLAAVLVIMATALVAWRLDGFVVVEPEPTTIVATEAPELLDEATPTLPNPTVVANSVSVVGNVETAVWENKDGLFPIPASGGLPLPVGERIAVQANAGPLMIVLPSQGRLLLAENSRVSLSIADQATQTAIVELERGAIILEDNTNTIQVSTLPLVTDAVVAFGSLGMSRERNGQHVEINCFVGTCRFVDGAGGEIDVDADSYAAVAADETTIGLIDDNRRRRFASIYDGLVVGVPTGVPTPLPTATSTPSPRPTRTGDYPVQSVLAQSANGTDIPLFQFGDGEQVIIFVGGIHAAYSPTSVEVVETAVDYFSINLDQIPRNVTAYFIPNLNPDSDGEPGAASARFNGNGVDLNRNADCNWSADPFILTRNFVGAGGTEPFSEPELSALRDLILETEADAVLFWTATQGRSSYVSPGACTDYSEVSAPFVQYFGQASGYDYLKSLLVEADPDLTGDISNWLDSIGIPAIFVLLPFEEPLVWEWDRAGILASLDAVSQIDGLVVTPTPIGLGCDEAFINVWQPNVYDATLRLLGCPTAVVTAPGGAIQAFENGWMVWRSDTDTVYVLTQNGSNQLQIRTVGALPVSGFQAGEMLKNAFGYLHTNVPAIGNALGNPLAAEEVANDFRVQDFENGVVFSVSNDNGRIFILNTVQTTWKSGN